MTPSALDADQKVLTYHRLAEALKFSRAAKHHVRDMKFTTADVSQTPLCCVVFVTSSQMKTPCILDFTVLSLVLLASPPSVFSHPQLKKLSEDAFADHLRSLISSDHTNQREFYNISSQLDTVGTTHVSVLAEDGSAASITSTINHMCVCVCVCYRCGRAWSFVFGVDGDLLILQIRVEGLLTKDRHPPQQPVG